MELLVEIAVTEEGETAVEMVLVGVMVAGPEVGQAVALEVEAEVVPEVEVEAVELVPVRGVALREAAEGSITSCKLSI